MSEQLLSEQVEQCEHDVQPHYQYDRNKNRTTFWACIKCRLLFVPKGTDLEALQQELDDSQRVVEMLRGLLSRMEPHVILRYVEGPNWVTGDPDELAYFRRLAALSEGAGDFDSETDADGEWDQSATGDTE